MVIGTCTIEQTIQRSMFASQSEDYADAIRSLYVWTRDRWRWEIWMNPTDLSRGTDAIPMRLIVDGLISACEEAINVQFSYNQICLAMLTAIWDLDLLRTEDSPVGGRRYD